MKNFIRTNGKTKWDIIRKDIRRITKYESRITNKADTIELFLPRSKNETRQNHEKNNRSRKTDQINREEGQEKSVLNKLRIGYEKRQLS